MAEKNNLNFDTKYTRKTNDTSYDFPSSIYDKEQDSFHMEVNALGQNEFVKDKERVNWYEQIQSYHDGCALQCLLKKYEQTGDASVLNRKTGEYFDATDMPNTLIGMYKKVQEGEQFFDKLPKEVKEQFNNSFTEFLAKGGVIENANTNSNNVASDNIPTDTTKSNKKVKEEKENED